MIDTNSTALHLSNDLTQRLRGNVKTILWSGIGFLVLGALAMIFPVVFSISLELIIGWLLVFAGAMGLFNAFSYNGTGPFFAAFLTGLMALAVGIYFIFNPFHGLLVLTLTLAAIFLVDGTFRMVAAFELRPSRGWGWVMFSGLLSIVLGLLILSGLPSASAVLIGLLFGINMFFYGLALFMLAQSLKKMGEV